MQPDIFKCSQDILTIFCRCLDLKSSASISPDSCYPSDSIGCTEHFTGQRGKDWDLLVPHGEISVQHVILLPSAAPFEVLLLFTPEMSCPLRRMLLVSSVRLFSLVETLHVCIPSISRQTQQLPKLFATIHIPPHATACPYVLDTEDAGETGDGLALVQGRVSVKAFTQTTV